MTPSPPCRCDTFESKNLLPGPLNGLIGLGQSDVSVMSQLVQAGTLLRNIFSHCLGGPEGGSGFLTLGGTGSGTGTGGPQPRGAASQGSAEGASKQQASSTVTTGMGDDAT